jgi:hypothetical protein
VTASRVTEERARPHRGGVPTPRLTARVHPVMRYEGRRASRPNLPGVVPCDEGRARHLIAPASAVGSLTQRRADRCAWSPDRGSRSVSTFCQWVAPTDRADSVRGATRRGDSSACRCGAPRTRRSGSPLRRCGDSRAGSRSASVIDRALARESDDFGSAVGSSPAAWSETVDKDLNAADDQSIEGQPGAHPTG